MKLSDVKEGMKVRVTCRRNGIHSVGTIGTVKNLDLDGNTFRVVVNEGETSNWYEANDVEEAMNKKETMEKLKRDIEAVERSIVKWKDNALLLDDGAKGVERPSARPKFSAGDCPLCNLYNSCFNINNKRCDGCPIQEKSGQSGCNDTPYVPCVAHYRDDDMSGAAKHAHLEVQFLEDILKDLRSRLSKEEQETTSPNLRDWCKMALSVQDACNLSGVVHGLGRIQSEMVDQGMGTDERNKHPVTKMFVVKLCCLSGVDYTFPSEDYKFCLDEAEK